MDEKELPKNPQTESWVSAKIKRMEGIVASDNPGALWISESDWPQGGFNNTYLQKLQGIIPLPNRIDEISDPLAKDTATKEMLDRLGVKEWKLNACFSGWDIDDRHIYAKTNIPDVYAHQLTWRGSGWGGNLVFVSANLDEEKIASISNIKELKMEWEEKYKKIESALIETNPRTILIKDAEAIRSPSLSESMLGEIFKNIPKWDSLDVSLSEVKNGEDSPSAARIIDLLLEYGLDPRLQHSIGKDAETSSQQLRWFYYRTKLPNVFLHKVSVGLKKDNASILPPTVLKSQTFVTVNCAEEQFKLE